MGFVECFKSIIHEKFKLEQEKGCWLVKELNKNSNNCEIRVGGCRTFAFSLDVQGVDAFPIFTQSESGIRDVVDAILVVEYDGKCYIIALEMKSSKKGLQKAYKQIANAHIFIRWVTELLKLHMRDSFHQNFTFLGVVSLPPRKQPAKGTTRRCAEINMPKKVQEIDIFVLNNHPKIAVVNLINKIKER